MSSYDDYADFDELEDGEDGVAGAETEFTLSAIDPESATWHLEDNEDETQLTLTVECRPIRLQDEDSGEEEDSDELAELRIEAIPFPGQRWDDVAELGGSWSGYDDPVRASLAYDGSEWRMDSVDIEVADYHEGELSLQITLGEDIDGLGFDTLELGVDADFELYRWHEAGPLLDTTGLTPGKHDKTFELGE